MAKKQAQYIDSEHYRQMLVRDGDRRFQEWHTSFLNYQKQFLREVRQSSTNHQPTSSDC
ncbi:MAG: hypothetical protein VKJ64_18265 [Leptolyngbyaceae bacterium]|nr:hypothetical protein [Leptolyngbyaceae bacterium]